MVVTGQVVNGKIVLDGASRLPEGSQVRVELTEDDVEEIRPPLEPFDRLQDFAILRESIEDMKAGRGRPARVVLKEIAERYNLPLEPGE